VLRLGLTFAAAAPSARQSRRVEDGHGEAIIAAVALGDELNVLVDAIDDAVAGAAHHVVGDGAARDQDRRAGDRKGAALGAFRKA
jgi:hypothetical protein